MLFEPMNPFKQIFFGTFCLLTSCQTIETVDFPLPYEGRKGVLTGFLSAEHGLIVHVGVTRPPLNGKEDTLKNIQFVFKEGEQTLISPTYQGEKLWQAIGFRPKPAEKYQLMLIADGISSVTSATVQLPQRVELNQVKVFSTTDSLVKTLNYRFQDPVEDNFYALQVLQYYQDSLLTESATVYPSAYHLLFDDKNSAGQFVQQNYRVDLAHSKGYKLANRFKIQLFSLNKFAYSFLKSLSDASFVEGRFL
jgi:hypothetical protein